jgi:DNA-binding response OmpR family regulator
MDSAVEQRNIHADRHVVARLVRRSGYNIKTSLGIRRTMIHADLSRVRNDDTASVPRQTIMLVDDDPTVANLVREILEGEGYLVETAGTGGAAEAMIEHVRPNLVILDIMLPDADGLMLCARLLGQWPAPVIMLSGSRRESDRILSLRLGADDFIAKPFDTFELVARVQAVLRRSPRELGMPSTSPLAPAAGAAAHRDFQAGIGGRENRRQDGPGTVGALTIDPRRRTVTIGDAPLQLTPTENRLLTALASDAERVFSRDELAGVLWGYDSLGESRAVDVHIRRLRAKLEPFGDTAPPIVTVRGFGYKLGRSDEAAAN